MVVSGETGGNGKSMVEATGGPRGLGPTANRASRRAWERSAAAGQVLRRRGHHLRRRAALVLLGAEKIADGALIQRLALHEFVHFLERQRLIPQQRLGQHLELVAVLLEHGLRFAVGLIDEALDFLVDEPGGVVGVGLVGLLPRVS